MTADTNGISTLRRGSLPCECVHDPSQTRLIAVTGGPGGGKSAVLELAARSFCSHVVILPESATILFGGGFPRMPQSSARGAAQRAIFHVQRELERLAIEDGRFSMILCDRGTLDGIAYWPGEADDFWKDLQISRESELSRYHAVLHLETPSAQHGYNHQNSVRVETPQQAHVVDLRILSVWDGHPRRESVPSTDNFPEKAFRALEVLRAWLPESYSRRRPPKTGG